MMGKNSAEGATFGAGAEDQMRDQIRKIRTGLQNSVAWLGVRSNILRPERHPKKVILMYHGIDRVGCSDFNPRFVSAGNFEKHLRYLAENCDVVPLSHIYDEGVSPTRLTVAITFDDGYENNARYAAPLLEQYGLPATFFVTGLNATGTDILWADFLDIAAALAPLGTIESLGRRFKRSAGGEFCCIESGKGLGAILRQSGFAEKKAVIDDFLKHMPDFRRDGRYDDYWRLMSDEQIRQVSKSRLIEIGSHGFYHNNLGNIDLADAREELRLSKAYLEELMQKPVTAVAYPDGSYSRAVVDAAESLGFKHQLAVDYRHPEDAGDPRIRSRFGIYPSVFPLEMFTFWMVRQA